MSKRRFHQIVSRLDRVTANHRCPVCGARCTVDRSCADTCVVECSDIFCDFVLIARKVKGKWRGKLADELVTAPKRGCSWMVTNHDATFRGEDAE